jgi:hypothetical protein
MKFTKMQGIGNDYVYVNGFSETVADPARLAREVSDRHFGIGADGLILILPSKLADVRMRMFNADGSEAEMCGNGIRCVAKYAFERGIATKNPMRIETGNGVLALELHVESGTVRQVTVNMGQPILELAKIPVIADLVSATEEAHQYAFKIDLRLDGESACRYFRRECRSGGCVAPRAADRTFRGFSKADQCALGSGEIPIGSDDAHLGARERDHAGVRHGRLRGMRRRRDHRAHGS